MCYTQSRCDGAKGIGSGAISVFPIGELMDEAACLQCLEQYLHQEGLRCPRAMAQLIGAISAAVRRFPAIAAAIVTAPTRWLPVPRLKRLVSRLRPLSCCFASDSGCEYNSVSTVEFWIWTDLKWVLDRWYTIIYAIPLLTIRSTGTAQSSRSGTDVSKLIPSLSALATQICGNAFVAYYAPPVSRCQLRLSTLRWPL